MKCWWDQAANAIDSKTTVVRLPESQPKIPFAAYRWLRIRSFALCQTLTRSLRARLTCPALNTNNVSTTLRLHSVGQEHISWAPETIPILLLVVGHGSKGPSSIMGFSPSSR